MGHLLQTTLPIAELLFIAVLERGLSLALPVFILHTLAFGTGYIIPKYGMKMDESCCRSKYCLFIGIYFLWLVCSVLIRAQLIYAVEISLCRRRRYLGFYLLARVMCHALSEGDRSSLL